MKPWRIAGAVGLLLMATLAFAFPGSHAAEVTAGLFISPNWALPNETISVTCIVLDEDRNPVYGADITILLGGIPIGANARGTTDPLGAFESNFSAPAEYGTYMVRAMAVFQGTESFAEEPLVVDPDPEANAPVVLIEPPPLLGLVMPGLLVAIGAAAVISFIEWRRRRRKGGETRWDSRPLPARDRL